jgi:hypothetical protein
MSTSLLYHGFGIVGYSYIRTDYLEGNIFHICRRVIKYHTERPFKARVARKILWNNLRTLGGQEEPDSHLVLHLLQEKAQPASATTAKYLESVVVVVPYDDGCPEYGELFTLVQV